MRKLMFVAVFSILFGVGQAKASPCASGTIASYASTTCTIDGLTFSNFTPGVLAASPGLAAFLSTNIVVTPVSNASGVGFELTPLAPADWTTNQSSQTLDLDWQFVVVCTNGTACIDDIFEQIAGTVSAATPPLTLGGADTLTETYCLGSFTLPTGSCPSGDTAGEQILTTSSAHQTVTANPGFTAVNAFAMNKDVSVQSFQTNTASLTSLFDQFSLVSSPEPNSFSMLIFGLLGIGLFSLRRKGVA